MLNENVANIDTVIDAMINFHRTGDITSCPPGVKVIQKRTPANKDGILEIEYGYRSTAKGKIKIKDGQFELDGFTVNNIYLNNLNLIYNYDANLVLFNQQSFIDALKSPDLRTSKGYFALIILTSESCRSVMVRQAMRKLMADDNGRLPDNVWQGLNFAFHNYSATAQHLGYNIEAGSTPWTPLTADNYISFINKKFNADDSGKELRINLINAVKQYIGNSSNTTHQSTSSNASTSGSHN